MKLHIHRIRLHFLYEDPPLSLLHNFCKNFFFLFFLRIDMNTLFSYLRFFFSWTYAWISLWNSYSSSIPVFFFELRWPRFAVSADLSTLYFPIDSGMLSHSRNFPSGFLANSVYVIYCRAPSSPGAVDFSFNKKDIHTIHQKQHDRNIAIFSVESLIKVFSFLDFIQDRRGGSFNYP